MDRATALLQMLAADPLPDESRDVARAAAAVVREQEDLDHLVDVLEGCVMDDPACFDAVVNAASVRGSLQRHGAAAIEAIHEAALRVAQEVDDLEGGTVHLFALPLVLPRPPKHLTKKISEPVRAKLTRELKELQFFDDDGEVTILPILLPATGSYRFSLSQVRSLAEALAMDLSIEPEDLPNGVTSATAFCAEPEKEADGLVPLFEDAASDVYAAMLVGVIHCEDRYDTPFPINRAEKVAKHNLPDPGTPGFTEAMADLTTSSLHRRMELTAALAKGLKEPDLAAVDGPCGWHEAHGLATTWVRLSRLRKDILSAAEDFGAKPEELCFELPAHTEAGVSMTLRHKEQSKVVSTPLAEDEGCGAVRHMALYVARELEMQAIFTETGESAEATDCPPTLH